MIQPAAVSPSASPGRSRRAFLVHNPTAGRRRADRLLGAINAELEAAGWQVECRVTAAPGDATGIAAAAVEAGADTLFVLGGDGTLREAAAGLVEIGRRGEPAIGDPAVGGPAIGDPGRGARRPALAVLPGGTTNVLAHALGLPADPVAAARAHASSTRRRFDVGWCGETPFLMMLSAGLDAHTVAHLSPALKARLGKSGIALQGLREWLRYGFPQVAVTVDGEELPPASFAAVCNIPYYGGPFALAPGASWQDGRLDLVAHHGIGRASALRFAWALARGRHLDRADVQTRAADEVILDGPPGLFLQVDGDICVEQPPVRVRVAGEVTVLALAGSGDGGDTPTKGAL